MEKQGFILKFRNCSLVSCSSDFLVKLGAHPVVQVETTPVSQTEIEITWETFGEHSDDIMFNIYRYHDGSQDHEEKIENVTLNDLPYKDAGVCSVATNLFSLIKSP